MIHLRRATVIGVREKRPGLLEVRCEIDGTERPALALEAHTGPIEVGDVVIVNASAIELRLGTGGYDFVIAVEGAASRNPDVTGHAMKLRYTALQSIVEPVEETHSAEMDGFTSLGGAPVVLTGLHSALPAVALGVRSVAPEARVVYVMTDAAALPIAISDTVVAMRDAGLLTAAITAGQAFGGDLEAVNIYSALVAARVVAHADVIVAGMGPGNLGTGSRIGFASIEQAGLVNAVAALGGTPIVVARLSASDTRERHRGLSHHTVTALGLALAPSTLVLPDLDATEGALVTERVRELADAVTVRTVPLDQETIEALAHSPVRLATMGRTYDDDPLPFRAAAAAGLYAAGLIGRPEG